MEKLPSSQRTKNGIPTTAITFEQDLNGVHQTLYYIVVKINGTDELITRAHEGGTFDSVEAIAMNDLQDVPPDTREIVGAGHITIVRVGNSLLGNLINETGYIHGRQLADQRLRIKKGLQELFGSKVSLL